MVEADVDETGSTQIRLEGGLAVGEKGAFTVEAIVPGMIVSARPTRNTTTANTRSTTRRCFVISCLLCVRSFTRNEYFDRVCTKASLGSRHDRISSAPRLTNVTRDGRPRQRRH